MSVKFQCISVDNSILGEGTVAFHDCFFITLEEHEVLFLWSENWVIPIEQMNFIVIRRQYVTRRRLPVTVNKFDSPCFYLTLEFFQCFYISHELLSMWFEETLDP